MKVCLVGPGDLDLHAQIYGIDKSKLEKVAEEIGRILAESGVEIVLLPDRGISYRVAESYKKHNGKRVWCTVPLSDKVFHTDHLEPYRCICDETINTGDWFRQDLTICLFGHCILCLGLSLGTVRDFTGGYYLYKLFKGKKPTVSVDIKKVHPQAVAGEIEPYTMILYMPLIKEKSLPPEMEDYIKAVGGEVRYVHDLNELKSVLLELQSKESK